MEGGQMSSQLSSWTGLAQWKGQATASSVGGMGKVRGVVAVKVVVLGFLRGIWAAEGYEGYADASEGQSVHETTS
jgi:hypothetical protein